ncbi:hypothetical protein EPO05_01940 [Patescibacteria group bacterium]|nr:MAG: hypothetical protein EPO05_01940 [Patescibacteria group bacterium]
MLTNCSKIADELNFLKTLKEKFDAELKRAKTTNKFETLDKLQQGMEKAVRIIDAMVDTPQRQFERWAKKYNLERFAERLDVVAGGRTKSELKQALAVRKINVGYHAEKLIDSQDFVTLAKPERLNLVRLTVEDLGFEDATMAQEIYQKAQEFGLDLCPTEVGPQLPLQGYASDSAFAKGKFVSDTNYTSDHLNVAMKSISNPDQDPGVFDVYLNNGATLMLDASKSRVIRMWLKSAQFCFCLPPQPKIRQ